MHFSLKKKKKEELKKSNFSRGRGAVASCIYCNVNTT